MFHPTFDFLASNFVSGISSYTDPSKSLLGNASITIGTVSSFFIFNGQICVKTNIQSLQSPSEEVIFV